LVRIYEGKPGGKGLRIAVVVSRFNSRITDRLLDGALDALRRCGLSDEDVDVVRVPGAFEIPVTGARLAATGRFGAVVCLGAVIKGGTPHWEYLSAATSNALALATVRSGVPFAFGLLTTETEEAALERAGVRGDNKGYEAALAAVEMADLFRQLGSSGA
jgi:6,7-dimethyl-8-ribityllumazine synthase